MNNLTRASFVTAVHPREGKSSHDLGGSTASDQQLAINSTRN